MKQKMYTEKEVMKLKKLIANYEFGARAGYTAQVMLLKQHAAFMNFADIIACALRELKE